VTRCGPEQSPVTPGAINPLDHLGLIGEALKGIGINPKLRRKPKGDGEGEEDAREDAEQEAIRALCRAARKWRGGTWSTYAIKSIQNALIDLSRKGQHWPRRFPRVFSKKTGEEFDYEETIQDRPTNDTLKEADARLDTQALLAVLSDREKPVVVLLYGLDGDGKRTQAEAARLLGISQQMVGRLHARAIARMRRAAGVPGDGHTSENKSCAGLGCKKCRPHVE
jgi:RNA polymerase sigma factor (sigma-70 family)